MEIKIERPDDALSRLTMILWGESGCGKTTLAATAPGKKLWLLFDPDGDMSIRHMPNWSRINLTTNTPSEIMRSANDIDPFGITTILKDYDTLIFDSLTKFSEIALRYAVTQPQASGARFRATYEAPGISGYGLRNSYVGSLISNLLRITGKLNKHLILITHERDGDIDDQGRVVSVKMMLGGQLPNVTSKDISEVWHMRDQNGKRTIAIRPERLRSPMKSRMFDMTSATSFTWFYNANKQEGQQLADWWHIYTTNGHKKLELPK